MTPEEEAREAWISGGATWIGGGADWIGGADHGRRRRRGRKEMCGGAAWFGVACRLGGASGGWGGREEEEADSRQTGKSRNKFLSPLHTF
jgi:hypothetical protein